MKFIFIGTVNTFALQNKNLFWSTSVPAFSGVENQWAIVPLK